MELSTLQAKCKGCKAVLDETTWTRIYEQSYQKDYCMECYGSKIADLVIFTRDFTKDFQSDLIGMLHGMNEFPKQPIRNWINKQFSKYLTRVLKNYDMEYHLSAKWDWIRHDFDSLIEAAIMDQCVGCEERK